MAHLYLVIQIGLFLVQAAFSFESNINEHGKKRVFYLRHGLDITFIIGALLLIYEMPGRYSAFILSGIGFSVVGDLIMSGAIKLKNRLPVSMISFAVTHYLYISAFCELMNTTGNEPCSILPYTIGTYLVLTSIMFMCFVKQPSQGKLINNCAFIYGLIVSLMAAFGGVAALTLGGSWCLLGPATGLFLISDAIIALTEIGGHKIPKSGWIIWVTYSAAQIGIITAGLF